MDVFEVLNLLKSHNNVLVSGPPGTGKTLLLNEVSTKFREFRGIGYDPEGDIPYPDSEVPQWMPSSQSNLICKYPVSHRQATCLASIKKRTRA